MLAADVVRKLTQRRFEHGAELDVVLVADAAGVRMSRAAAEDGAEVDEVVLHVATVATASSTTGPREVLMSTAWERMRRSSGSPIR